MNEEAALLGLASGAISMVLYARLSPQARLRKLKAEQRQKRAALTAHEGSWSELKQLIRADLKLSLAQIFLMLAPFAFSVLPVLALAFFFNDIIGQFPFTYVGALIAASLIAKFAFKII